MSPLFSVMVWLQPSLQPVSRTRRPRVRDTAIIAACITDKAIITACITYKAIIAACITDKAIIAASIADKAIIAACIADVLTILVVEKVAWLGHLVICVTDKKGKDKCVVLATLELRKKAACVSLSSLV